MLHKREKELLLRAYEAPKPVKKKAFLQKFPSRDATIGNLILSQTAYVRKRVWIVSVIALFSAAFLTRIWSDEYVWILSALSTCASVSFVAELAKSVSFKMSELEAATRFSLRLIMLARMCAIGMVHIVILLFVIPFMGDGSSMEIWRKAVYIAVPYLLTAGLGLCAVRESGKRESMPIVASGIGVGILFPAIQWGIFPIYGEQYIMYWTVGGFLLLLWFVKQFKITIHATEKLV